MLTYILQHVALILIPECQSFNSTLHKTLRILYALIIAYVSCAMHYPAYIVFLSALYVVMITDINTMLISRWSSLYFVPTGWILSFYNLIPLSLYESILASCVGFCFLWLINWIFFCIKKQDGIGQGDIDLIALIGAYTGFLGIWFALLLGSTGGTLAILILMHYKKTSLNKICFGPFLSIATLIFLIVRPTIIALIV